MGKDQQDHVAQFDAFFSTKQLKLLKLFLPYLDSSLRKKMIIYIKYREWQITMQYLNRPRLFCEQRELSDNLFLTDQTKDFCLDEIITSVKPYLSEEEYSKIQQFQGLKENMEMIRQLQDVMEACGGMEQDFGSIESIIQMFQGKM